MSDSRRRLSTPYACWALGWVPGEMVVAAHATYIPELPRNETAMVRSDGLWGPHEWTRFPQNFDPRFPYLGWIRLPTKETLSSILYRLPTRLDVRPHPISPLRIILSPEWIDELRNERDVVQARAQQCFSRINNFPALRHVSYPSTAPRRIVKALMLLKDTPCFWRDIIEAVRAIQRHLLELQAFCDWFTSCTSEQRTAMHVPTRGIITTDPCIYEMLQSKNVTVYLRLRLCDYHVFPPTRQKGLLRLVDWATFIGVDFSEWRDEGVPAGSVQDHTKDLWYYPPTPANDQLYELAARGYSPRRDSQHLTQRSVGRQMRREQDLTHERNLVNGSRPKHTQNSRRVQNMVARPDWVPRVIETWATSVPNTAPIFVDKELTRGWSYHLPPIHLFWGSAEQSTRETFFYHWYCLARCWDLRHIINRNLAFSPSDWRSFLGDTHWMRQWPKDEPYEPAKFWAHGSEKLFGHLSSGFVSMGMINRPLPCGCTVSPSISYHPAIRAILLYKLNMAHISWEFEHHDEAQISATEWDEDRRSRRAEQRKKVWPYGPNHGDMQIGYQYGCQKKDWRDRMLWFEDLRDIMSSWKGFPRVLDSSLIPLQHDDYIDRESKLIKFYQDSFISTHGALPSLPMQRVTECPPTCAHNATYFC